MDTDQKTLKILSDSDLENDSGNQIGKAFYVGRHRYLHRAGEPAEILGVAIVTPAAFPPRPCFKVRYQDGYVDYVVINDRDFVGPGSFYEIISEADVKAGKIPHVTV